ncbi:hypothetical protein MOMA_04600 [Moraxella macacae 0408225]|uniref:Lcl C-terminal domain-containing protein n=1 Tax=Moraxella macacae 0408225 TaxID=1230338 RepID=L2FA85_9GAMM|nr:DUF1566 domain-containing protein [Moraxella macacae]ELA09656.1 hypothetical protein MOMA_04600 [Moraxella macacae 0408225]
MKKLLLLSIAGLMSFSSFADEQVCHPTVQATTPDSRFEILGDGSEVKDTKTNLIWQRCSIGQTWDKTAKTCQGSPKTFASWKEALTETHKLGNGYRLPNVKELQSIVEYKCRPFINKKIFVGYDGDVTDWYFSSTPDVRDNNVFSVNFDKSTTRSVGKLDITNTARAVRSAK